MAAADSRTVKTAPTDRLWLSALRRGAGRTTLVVWFVAMTLCCAGLLARHVLAMPAPTKTARLGHHLGALRSPTQPHAWLAVHVLGSECRCSLRVVAHLLEGPRPAGWSEVVLWVGDITPPTELTAHFDVRRVTAADLASSLLGIRGLGASPHPP